jgi:hypothetical protein
MLQTEHPASDVQTPEFPCCTLDFNRDLPQEFYRTAARQFIPDAIYIDQVSPHMIVIFEGYQSILRATKLQRPTTPAASLVLSGVYGIYRAGHRCVAERSKQRSRWAITANT